MSALLLFLHAVCPLVFFTDLTRNPYTVQIYLLQGGLLLALALWLLSALRRGAASWPRTPLAAPVLAWTAVALASWGASWAAHPSLRPSIFHEGFRNGFFLWVNLLIPFFLGAVAGGEDRRFHRVALAVAALASAYGLMQYFGVEPIWDKALNPYNGRPVSTFGNPNFLSSYLVMALPFAVEEFLSSRPSSRPGWGLLLLLYGAALIATMTRSSWIGAAVAAALLLGTDRPAGRDLKALLLPGAILLAMGLAWPGSPLAAGRQDPVHRVAELLRGMAGGGVYGSWHQRLLIWSCAWDMFKGRPLLGKGWGCFELFYPFYQGARLLNPVFRPFRTHANNAHNVVMEVASQTGVAGLGVAAWGLLLAGSLLRARSSAPDRKALMWARAAALGGMLADNFFGNVSLFFAVPGFFFAWTAGGLAADLSTGRREVPSRRPLFLAAALPGLAAAVAGMVWCCRAWGAETAYFEGYKRAGRGDFSGAVRFLEDSRRLRRYEVNNDYELGNAYLRQSRLAAENGLTEEPRALLSQALSAYDDALAANAGYDEIHVNRSSVLLSLGRTEEAAADLRAALAINPLHEQGYLLLGGLYARSENAARGEALFTRAVSFFPRRADFWTALGDARLACGRPPRAADAYARALSLDVDSKDAAEKLRTVVQQGVLPSPPILQAPVLAGQVRAAARLQRWGEALAKADALTGLAPECPLVWLMEADLRAASGDAAGALDAYDRLISLDPAHRAGRLNKARTLLRLGRRGEARSLADELLRENPSDGDARALRDSIDREPAAP